VSVPEECVYGLPNLSAKAFSCQTSAISFPFIPIPWKNRIIAMGCSTSVQSRKLQSHVYKSNIFSGRK